ncbi:MAG: AmmeMemoRadiSam system protein B [Anaerolineales bacterium]
MQVLSSVRPSPIAGTWYEGDPKSLARSVDAYMDEATLPDLPGKLVAVIAPHAGHRYSGAVAGYAFAALRGQSFDLVAVVAPMHHPYRDPLITTAHTAYATPLGNVAVDREAVYALDTALQARLGFGLSAVSNDPEHSLEIELPFLQRALGSEFKLLPVMVRAQQPAISLALGESLAKVLRGKNAMLVASTDLSHFYEQKVALRFDRTMLEQMEAFSPEGIFQAEQSGTGFACGHAAMAAVLWAARELGADTVRVLRHATSGDVTGDYAGVVGYASAVVLKTN